MQKMYAFQLRTLTSATPQSRCNFCKRSKEKRITLLSDSQAGPCANFT